jgi:EmrB/QacA subfamily drug resistance transporter
VIVVITPGGKIMAIHSPATAAHARAGLIQRGGGGPRRRWLGLVLLCLAQLMLVLDVTVVNVALPDIGAGLHLARPALTWVLTAYTVAFGGLMLLGGRLADLFGARRVLLTGLVIFTGASMASGLATGGPMLIGGRAAQGLGAALLSPSALSIVTTSFSGSERNKALGIWAAVGGAGAALGVIVGGVLTSIAGWSWVFFINVPIGLLVLATLPALLPAGRPARGRTRVDVAGAVAVTAATGAVIYGLIDAGSHGWLTARALVPAAAAVFAYAAFAAIERQTRTPLMDVRVLTQRPVAVGAFLMLAATGLLVGAFFLGSFYLQQVRGYSALHTGLAFLPVAIATVIGAQTASHLVSHVDRRALSSGALTLAAGGALIAAGWTGPVTLVTGMSVAALGLGATLVTAMTTALASVGAHESGLRSGIVNTFHELGGAAGVAAVSSIAAPSLSVTALGITGFTHAFVFCAAAAVAAGIVAALAAPAGAAPAGAMPHAH